MPVGLCHTQGMTQMSDGGASLNLHVVKRYADARLYDTTTLSYVTVDQLRGLLRAQVDVAIYDARDRADVTRSVLALN
jgi:polyhydroxyalkanoate synthesis regulator protein